MSYNIGSTRFISGALTITPDAIDAARERIGEDTAECCFLDDGDMSGALWYGMCSGRSFESFLTALTYTRGSADILVVWEGGDSLSGVRVRDGVVQRHHVSHALGAANGDSEGPS